jgi:hypothetical protein
MPSITPLQCRTEEDALLMLVERFSMAMEDELTDKAAEGRGGWYDPEAKEQFIAEALLHINRGDWIGAANYCAFLWNLEEGNDGDRD